MGRCAAEKLAIASPSDFRRFRYDSFDARLPKAGERRFDIGGMLGAAILTLARKRKWVVQDLDSRVLRVTARGRLDMLNLVGGRS